MRNGLGWRFASGCALFALALCVYVGSCEVRAAEIFRPVLCPPNWTATISQRIDTRDRFDWIVKRKWVPGCY